MLERVEAGGYRPRSLAYFERAVAAEAEAASGTAGAADAEDEGGDRRLDHGRYERVVRRNQSDVERLSGPR